MKTLITGATGFIGYHIAKLLLQKGYRLKILIHTSKRELDLFSSPNVELVSGDVLDLESLRRAVAGCNKIYHTAGIVSFKPSLKYWIYRVNVNGTENLCKVALEAKVERFIYTSSAASIGKNESGLSDETTPFNLWNISSDYKKSKVLAEDKVLEYCQKHGLPAVILNPSLPVGAYDFRPSPSGNMILNYLKNPIVIYVDGGMNFIDVEDVAQGHYLADTVGRIGERYILGNENLTIANFYSLLDRITGLNRKKLRFPYRLALLAGGVSQIIAQRNDTEPQLPQDGIKLVKKMMFYDVNKSKKELGLLLHPVKDACIKAIEWFHQERYV